MYMHRISMGFMGLFAILSACRYGKIVVVVGSLVILSLE